MKAVVTEQRQDGRAGRICRETPVVVIGGGPGGLTAANDLVERGTDVVVFEQDAGVGGISRTVEYKGFRFDIGGHRFFTKVKVVRELWRRMLGPDFLVRPRLSRIYYNGRFFDYPLRPFNALANLGIWTSALVLLSYLWVQVFPIRPEKSFADWVSNRFGRRLFGIFFKSYTEKVWGIPCTTIDAAWAAQRIKGLSLRSAVVNMLVPRRQADQEITTLIEQFEYPRLGPGMMWDAFRANVERKGGRVELNARIVGLHHDGQRIVTAEVEKDGKRFIQPASEVISTMPMRHLVNALRPHAPDEIVAAANRLNYRDFLTVALIVNQAEVFRDNWIYIHDPELRVGRIQNFKNWSPEMVPDPSLTCLGLEYFCFEGDGLWSMPDEQLIDLATRELDATGLAARSDVVEGVVVRVPKAYPVYDGGYLQALQTLKDYLGDFENLQLVGRNGMHKYNNQDHAMLTALLAVDNVYGGRHDLWAVNAEEEYHEDYSGSDSGDDPFDVAQIAKTQPMVPLARPTAGSGVPGGR